MLKKKRKMDATKKAMPIKQKKSSVGLAHQGLS
jgi:hypothetical protein